MNDKFERSTTGYLPEAHIAFLDETFKGSSAILNTLLTLLNERIFYNGTEARKCPLLMVVGASNEFGDDDVEALYDRFLLRYELEYVQDQNAVLLFRFETPQVTAKFSLAQLQQARSLVQQTTVSDDVLKVLVSIRTQLRLRGVFPSDRRLRQCLDLLKAKSWLDGVPIGEHHLLILENALWHKNQDREKVSEILVGSLSQDLLKARKILASARKGHQELLEGLRESSRAEKVRQLQKDFLKLTEPMTAELTALMERVPADYVTAIKDVQDKLLAIQRKVVDAQR